jgi:ornithine cyclodeaminase/alanine dehydrogenase-like protein (mu-crystallin family)
VDGRLAIPGSGVQARWHPRALPPFAIKGRIVYKPPGIGDEDIAAARLVYQAIPGG